MDEKPNVILLTIDSLRADHLGCLGYSEKVSPNIDDLAKKGVLFSQAISNGGNTWSSFPAILTSSYPRVHLSEEKKSLPYRWLFLSEKKRTLAEVLRENGYQTAAFHSNPWISSFFHYDRGFDTFDDQLDRLFVRSELFRDVDILNKILDKFRFGYAFYSILNGSKGNTDRAGAINKKAISWLKNRSGSFFLWLHYMDVHEPYIPLKGTILERINGLKLYKRSKNQKVFSEHDLEVLVNFYDREIEYVDREIGSFLDKISKMGISLDNTHIILTADHGEQFAEHGVIGHGYIYDEVIHVPLIIAGPRIKEDTVIQEQVCLLDLSPTILDLLDVPKVESFQGTSFLPAMNGKKSQKKGIIIEGNPFVYLGNLANRFAYRTEEWKYILLLDENNRQVDEELYDLQSDPEEKENILGNGKEIAEELKLKLLDHIAMEKQEQLKIEGRREVEYNEEEKREIEKRLKSLGYM